MQDKNFQYGLTFGSRSNENFRDVYDKFISADIAEAQAHLHELPKSQRRGLTLDTLRHFGCGYLSKWIYPKSRAEFVCGSYTKELVGTIKTLPTPSRRIIIPTPSMNHYNAVILPADRHTTDRPKPHAGKKNELFCDADALNQDFFVVVEGEIDAMSIWQVSGGKIPVVAILSCGNWKNSLEPRLKDLRGKKIILLLDGDAAGRKAAQELRNNLIGRGFVTAARFLYDDMNLKQRTELFGNSRKVDANDFLTIRELGGAYLNRLCEKIINNAGKGIYSFSDAESRIKDAEKFRAEYAAMPDPELPAPKRGINFNSAGLDDTPAATHGDYRRGEFSADIDALIKRINDTITFNDLEAENYLQHTDKGGARPNGYICPFCGSGTGENHSGALGFTATPPTRFKCLSCEQKGNVLTLLSKIYGIDNHGKAFYELLRRAADDFNIPYEPEIFERKTPAQIDSPVIDIDVVIEPAADVTQQIDSAEDSASATETAETADTDKQTVDVSASQAEEVTTGDSTLDDELQKHLTDWQRSNHSAINPEFGHEIAAAAVAVNVETINPADVATEHFRRQLAVLSFFARPMYLAALTKIYSQDEKPPLTRKKLEEDIERRITPIRRDQKKFTQDAEQKQRERETAAAVARYKAKMPTTQKEISDCPADLLIPENVYFDKSGVGLMCFQAGNCYKHPAALTPCVPVKMLRDPRNNSVAYEIAILSRGKWSTAQMTATDIADSKKILRLADYEARFEDAPKLCKFFARMLAVNENSIPEINCYSQPGWHGAKFIYPPSGEDYIVRRNNNSVNYAELFATQGDADKWRQMFGKIVADNNQGELKRIVLGAAAAAPLLKVLNLPNFCLHLQGRLNSAKTPLVKFAISLFGDPTEGKLLRSLAATAKNRLTMAASFNDLPTALDELEAADKRNNDDFGKSIYDFCCGVINQANRRNGDARPAENFRGVQLTTGERPILTDRSKAGALKRLLDFHVAAPLFDEMEARDLHIFCAENFGHFGRQWTNFISQHKDLIKQRFDEIISELRHCPALDYTAYLETHLRAVVACTLATQLLKLCVGIETEKHNVKTNAADDAKFIISHELPTKDAVDESKRALDALRSWIGAHEKEFIRPVKVEGKVSDFYPVGIVTRGKIFDTGEVTFFPTELTNALEKDLGFSSASKLITEWREKDILIVDAGHNTHKVTIGDRRPRMIHFKADILIGNIDEAELDHYEELGAFN